MAVAIQVQNLEKTYPGGIKAVQGVSFAVENGEIFGFLGPNGAGKTTTVAMLTTLIRPTAGSATVAGLDVSQEPEEVRRRIGLVFQSSTAEMELTGRENMQLQAGLFGLSNGQSRDRIELLLQRMNLTEAADRRAKGYSGGMKRRLELAVAMVHTPQILFLDEPTLGLDPQGRAGFWQYIRDLRKEQQVTIFMTTHYLDEVEGLCDRVAILDRGVIIASGTSDSLKQRVGGDVVEIRVGDSSNNLTPSLQEVPGVLAVQREGSAYRVKTLRGEVVVSPLVKACERAGATVLSLSIQRPSLDTVFLELTGRAFREEGYDAGRAESLSAFGPRGGGDR